MNERIEFEALRPRRWSAPPASEAPGNESLGNVVFRASEASSERETVGDESPSTVDETPAYVDEPPANVNKPNENVVFRASAVSSDESDSVPVEAEDSEERDAIMRDEAIRFAAIACSRALRESLTHDSASLTRYVDDALRACGRVYHPAVRLHPEEAACYRPQRDVDVVADAALMRGEVIVETETGAIGATIEERAVLLVRAAAHA